MAKNVVFFPFCILVDMPKGGAVAPPPGSATGYGISKTFQYFDLHNDLIKKTNKMTF